VITVLAPAAEAADEIDVERARRAALAASKAAPVEEPAPEKAHERLLRAKTRLQVASRQR